MNIKILHLFLIISSLAFANTQERPQVPTMDTQKINQYKGKCKVPEFLVNIPPMMELDYTTCVNDRFKPTKTLVEVVLKQQVSKKAELLSIVPAPRFYTRVYKVTYKIGSKKESMICNDKMTYCLPDQPVVSRER